MNGLIVTNLSKSYGSNSVLSNVSFHLNRNEICTFVGKNGTGKSTLLQILSGMIPADSGQVLIGDLVVDSTDVSVRKIIGYASATPKLIPSFTAQEYLSLCSKLHKIDSTTDNKRIDNLLTNFDLEQYRAYRLDQLSTGNIKLVAICAALLHQPPVLLLDEPYSGLDIKRRKTLSDTLIEISSSTQIVIASQNIDEIFKISNVIFLLQSGKIKKKWNIDSSDTLMLEDVKSFL